jgi:hypothetical protein
MPWSTGLQTSWGLFSWVTVRGAFQALHQKQKSSPFHYILIEELIEMIECF